MRRIAQALALILPWLGVSLLPAQDASNAAPGQLVRQVVWNELHDHQTHGYWRYWIEKHDTNGMHRDRQVETAQGPMNWLESVNGQQLNQQARHREERRVAQLLGSPTDLAKLRQQYEADEGRIGRIMALLPDAFVYRTRGEHDGLIELEFQPNLNYQASTVEARIFHAMAGQVWIDKRMKRLVRIDGTLQENVDFGFGLLGRLMHGGWFSLVRRQVSATDWKTESLEVHMTGRALLLATITRETSERRGGFEPVSSRLTLAQGAEMLRTDKPETVLASFERGQ